MRSNQVQIAPNTDSGESAGSGRNARRWLAPLVLLVLIGICWSVSAQVIESSVFPSPAETLASMSAELTQPRFLNSVLSTIYTLGIAFAGAVVLGASVGILVGLSEFWAKVLAPLVYALNSIPKVVLYPIFLLILGISVESRVAFATYQGFLPMFLMSLEAVGSVNRLHLKLAASLGMSTPQVVRKIVLPQLVPAILTAMRVTFGLVFIGVILAEMFTASTGLGFELLRNVTLVRMSNILGEVVVISAIALVPTTVMLMLERSARRRFSPGR